MIPRAHIHGTLVPVEEPSTASKAASRNAANNIAIRLLRRLGFSTLGGTVTPIAAL